MEFLSFLTWADDLASNISLFPRTADEKQYQQAYNIGYTISYNAGDASKHKK